MKPPHENAAARVGRAAAQPALFERRFVVEAYRDRGRWIEFSKHHTRAEAENTIRLLAWAGKVARIVEVQS